MKQILNNKVSQLRQSHSITQKDLGDAIGVTRQTVIAIERGNYVPSLLLALRISAFFKKNVEDIFNIVYEK